MSAGTVTAAPCDDNGAWLITLHGEHDLSTRPRLERQTRDIWPLCRIAVVDLSDTTFIDSGVIRWLLRVESALEAAGADTLSIVEGLPGSIAERLFGLLRMRHVLACYPTRAEALDQALVRTPSSRYKLVPPLGGSTAA